MRTSTHTQEASVECGKNTSELKERNRSRGDDDGSLLNSAVDTLILMERTTPHPLHALRASETKVKQKRVCTEESLHRSRTSLGATGCTHRACHQAATRTIPGWCDVDVQWKGGLKKRIEFAMRHWVHLGTLESEKTHILEAHDHSWAYMNSQIPRTTKLRNVL